MKSYRIILTFITALFIFTSCEDEVLNKSPRSSFSENDIWNDFELTKKYVWNTYNALGAWGIGKMSVTDYNLWILAGASDLAYGFHQSEDFETYMRGEINPDDMAPFDRLWKDHYDNIKEVNVFLENIDKVEADEAQKSRLIGEMRFIRAYVYHELVNIWGGVPLITEPFGLDDEFNVSRASYQEVVNFIVSELDAVSSLLPETIPSDEWGRVTKSAAMALKSRTLLYAASKLHDPSTQPAGPLYDYNSGDKWQAVSDAAKAVIDLGLFNLVPVQEFKDYNKIFQSNNEEIIFAKAQNPEFNHGASEFPDRLFRPAGFAAGWSTIQPLQSVVDAFEMSDGLSIEESPLYDGNGLAMYENREIRFYADIFYQGAPFNPPLQSPREPFVQYYLPGGLDGKDGAQDFNATLTGYNMRKYTNEDFDESLGFKSTTPYIYFRLAEIYLNYAEAQYHLGNEEVAREFINKIRNRVHLPSIGTSGDELLMDIRHERKIELCFENHRFWDVRRWMIAEDVLNEDGIGLQWQKLNSQGELDANGELTPKFYTVSDRNFKSDKMYYIPIPRSEIQKAELEQNVGYN